MKQNLLKVQNAFGLTVGRGLNLKIMKIKDDGHFFYCHDNIIIKIITAIIQKRNCKLGIKVGVTRGRK